jgi:RNA polymerase sigma-B factor
MPSRGLSQRPGTTRPAIVTEILLRRYAAPHRSVDLEELGRRHQPLARRIARRYRFSSVPRDDLEPAAYVGLLKAIRRFDPDRGCAFSTFAVPTIVGEVKRQCREAIWTTPRAAAGAGAGREDSGYELGECRATIEEALLDLTEDERTALYLRFAEEQTFAQIAQELEISTGQAARLLRRSVSHLKWLANQPDRPLIAASGAGPGRVCPSGG